MKKIVTKTFILAAFVLASTACVQEDEAVLPPVLKPFLSETFDSIRSEDDGDPFNFPGWTNFAEKGTKAWTMEFYRGDGTAQFNPYGSNQAQNIAWLITPKIEIPAEIAKPGFTFQTSQNFVTNTEDNIIEVYISTDYDGTNVLDAHWTRVENVRLATPDDGPAFTLVNAGAFDLTPYKDSEGVFIAFRAVGSGSNNDLDGLYQINNLHFYDKK